MAAGHRRVPARNWRSDAAANFKLGLGQGKAEVLPGSQVQVWYARTEVTTQANATVTVTGVIITVTGVIITVTIMMTVVTFTVTVTVAALNRIRLGHWHSWHPSVQPVMITQRLRPS